MVLFMLRTGLPDLSEIQMGKDGSIQESGLLKYFNPPGIFVYAKN